MKLDVRKGPAMRTDVFGIVKPTFYVVPPVFKPVSGKVTLVKASQAKPRGW